jgi:hypothetical protein
MWSFYKRLIVCIVFQLNQILLRWVLGALRKYRGSLSFMVHCYCFISINNFSKIHLPLSVFTCMNLVKICVLVDYHQKHVYSEIKLENNEQLWKRIVCCHYENTLANIHWHIYSKKIIS